MAQREPAEWEVPLGLGEEDRQQLRRIIGAFPKLTFAAGYGSGVVPQADATKLTKVDYLSSPSFLLFALTLHAHYIMHRSR